MRREGELCSEKVFLCIVVWLVAHGIWLLAHLIKQNLGCFAFLIRCIHQRPGARQSPNHKVRKIVLRLRVYTCVWPMLFLKKMFDKVRMSLLKMHVRSWLVFGIVPNEVLALWKVVHVDHVRLSCWLKSSSSRESQSPSSITRWLPVSCSRHFSFSHHVLNFFYTCKITLKWKNKNWVRMGNRTCAIHWILCCFRLARSRKCM